MCAAATAQSSTFLGMQNASDSVIIYDTPTPLPTQTPFSCSLSGYAMDSKGNKVAGAYVVLYRDNATAPIPGNPTYTASAPSGYGEYHFTGLQPGKYTILAEKGDIFLYNGTASITLGSGVDTFLNIVIKGYAARPTLTPTPMPVMAALTVPVVTALPVNNSTPGILDDALSKAREKALGPIAALFIIAIVGAAAMTLRDVLRPKKKTQLAVKKEPENTAAPRLQTNMADGGYTAEIRDLAAAIDSQGSGDIPTLNRINAMAKKYGIDQGKVFSDIKKVQSGKR